MTVLALALGASRVRTAVVLDDGTLAGRRTARTPRPLAELVDRCAHELRLSLAAARPQGRALGEGAFGAARGLTDYVYLTVSTGVGGVIVSDGRLLRGPDGLAGELGHMTIDVNGPVCGCGAG